AGGGYSPGLISATGRYIDLLLAARTDDALAALDLREVVARLDSEDVHLYEPYEHVHRNNVAAVRA
ncbi:MAG TPA: hypothetical protein VKT18_00355, partial [Acidimicrobiales bacterium]|nr:hypothetical protein [Acidimicrobiales bacterium]